LQTSSALSLVQQSQVMHPLQKLSPTSLVMLLLLPATAAAAGSLQIVFSQDA
jgi:hypothetical protein